MIKRMLINAREPGELRVALVEGGRLEAFFVETAAREQTRGNIYKGVVVNVERSLQAAFVDYGAGRNGFLQISDLCPAFIKGAGHNGRVNKPIQDVLRAGQELLVQVVKEETATKGASLTTFFSIPGQYMVLTPGHESQGVSRKIESEAERERIKEALAGASRPEGIGVIARTAAEGRSKREIQQNLQQLLRLWQDIKKRGDSAKPRTLIHREEELAVRVVRDHFTSDVTEILVDDQDVFNRLQRYLAVVSPRRKKQLKLYTDPRPIFQKSQLEQQILSIYQPTVPLPSGGSIVIHPTEALVSIDVNSGRNISGKQIEETALNVNKEAAVEVARQLRLRDLGGLVVVDFIDMRDRANQRTVRKVFADELKKDKAKITIGAISRFGLLELSRQRIRPPIDFGATMVCPHCQGRGLVRTTEAIGRGVMRALEHKLGSGDKSGVRVRVATETANYLQNVRRADLMRLEERYGLCIEVLADAGLSPEESRMERFEATWTPPQPAAPPVLQAVIEAPEEPEPEEFEEDETEDEDVVVAAEEPARKSSSRRRRGGRRKSAKKEAAAPAAQPQSEPEPAPVAESKAAAETPSAEASAEQPAAKKRRRRPSSRRRRKPAEGQAAEARSAIAAAPEHDGVIGGVAD